MSISVAIVTGASSDIGKATALHNAAIEALAKALAERGIEDGVQVNSLSPGAIMTGRLLSMLEKVPASKMITLEEAKQQFLNGRANRAE